MLRSEHIYFLKPAQQMGWVAIKQKLKAEFRSVWKEVHSLTFESG